MLRLQKLPLPHPPNSKLRPTAARLNPFTLSLSASPR